MEFGHYLSVSCMLYKLSTCIFRTFVSKWNFRSSFKLTFSCLRRFFLHLFLSKVSLLTKSLTPMISHSVSHRSDQNWPPLTTTTTTPTTAWKKFDTVLKIEFWFVSLELLLTSLLHKFKEFKLLFFHQHQISLPLFCMTELLLGKRTILNILANIILLTVWLSWNIPWEGSIQGVATSSPSYVAGWCLGLISQVDNGRRSAWQQISSWITRLSLVILRKKLYWPPVWLYFFENTLAYPCQATFF